MCIPANFPGNPIAFFDDFSWRSFVALVWPALQGQRGEPDPSQKVGTGSGPLVFETYKAEWEVFQPNGAPPNNWDQFGPQTPCPNVPTVGFNDMLLGTFSFSKFGNLGEAGVGNLVGPLVAQNQTYVRYYTGFNQLEFKQIQQFKWYLQENLGNITFQSGSIDVKSSWVDMTNIANPSRYHTRTAWMYDPPSNTCQQKTVGLVGLHIVQKTPSRPQWIWSTFEHVDNVPATPGASTATPPYAFNDNSGTPQPPSNPIPFGTNGPPFPVPKPFNVQRLTPIFSCATQNCQDQGVTQDTQTTNANYQKALQGTVWQNYQLVMTQWPLVPNSPQTPGSITNTFPGTIGATSAYANTTLETFDQTNIRSGCMNCHNFTKTNTDFLWSLAVNAWPPPSGQASAGGGGTTPTPAPTSPASGPNLFAGTPHEKTFGVRVQSFSSPAAPSGNVAAKPSSNAAILDMKALLESVRPKTGP